MNENISDEDSIPPLTEVANRLRERDYRLMKENQEVDSDSSDQWIGNNSSAETEQSDSSMGSINLAIAEEPVFNNKERNVSDPDSSETDLRDQMDVNVVQTRVRRSLEQKKDITRNESKVKNLVVRTVQSIGLTGVFTFT